MLEMGIIVAIGMIATFAKMSWRWRMKMLSNPFVCDVAIFVFLNALHWGTYSGLMVAAVGALACSVCLSLGRWMFGYQVNKLYVPGFINIRSKL